MLICLFIQYRLKFYHVINPKLLLAYFIFFPSRSLKSGVYSIYLRYLSIWIVHIQVNNSHSNYGLAQGWRNGNGTWVLKVSRVVLALMVSDSIASSGCRYITKLDENSQASAAGHSSGQGWLHQNSRFWAEARVFFPWRALLNVVLGKTSWYRLLNRELNFAIDLSGQAMSCMCKSNSWPTNRKQRPSISFE
jgi:hypothetical protein